MDWLIDLRKTIIKKEITENENPNKAVEVLENVLNSNKK